MTVQQYNNVKRQLQRPQPTVIADLPDLLRHGALRTRASLFMEWGSLERTLLDLDHKQRVMVALTAAELVEKYSPGAYQTVALATGYLHGKVGGDELDNYLKEYELHAVEPGERFAELAARNAADCALREEWKPYRRTDVECAASAVHSAAMAENYARVNRSEGALAAGWFTHYLWERARERLAFADATTTTLE